MSKVSKVSKVSMVSELSELSELNRVSKVLLHPPTAESNVTLVTLTILFNNIYIL